MKEKDLYEEEDFNGVMDEDYDEIDNNEEEVEDRVDDNDNNNNKRKEQDNTNTNVNNNHIINLTIPSIN